MDMLRFAFPVVVDYSIGFALLEKIRTRTFSKILYGNNTSSYRHTSQSQISNAIEPAAAAGET
eukprot:scaffold119746_cov48-Attheya_sp.AAC.3